MIVKTVKMTRQAAETKLGFALKETIQFSEAIFFCNIIVLLHSKTYPHIEIHKAW